jgi:hypothetical protein
MKETVMYICAVSFEDLMFQQMIWNIRNDRKGGFNSPPDIIKAYAAFLSGERAELALSGDYDALLRKYEEFLLTEDGIILDRQKFFPHLIAVDEYDELNVDEAQPPENLVIKSKNKQISIEFDDIRYIEAADKVACIRLKRDSVICSKPFTFIEPLLPEDRFFRCHKSFIIGFKHIITHSERSVIFDNGEKAVVSKRKYAEFKVRYGEYLRENG